MIVLLKTLVRTMCAVTLVAGLDLAEPHASVVIAEVVDRDKTGTTGVQEKEGGSQAAIVKALTSRVSFTAEGMGLEPTTGKPAPDFESDRTSKNPRESSDSESCAAPDAAVVPEIGELVPDLQLVIDQWLELPEAIRAGILAMVRAVENFD